MSKQPYWMCHAHLTLQKKTFKNIENAQEYVEAKSVKGEKNMNSDWGRNKYQARKNKDEKWKNKNKEKKQRWGEEPNEILVEVGREKMQRQQEASEYEGQRREK